MSAKKTNPTFFSLFVPQEPEWLQELVTEKLQEESLSRHLLDLIVYDLKKREALTPQEVKSYRLYRNPVSKNGKVKKSTAPHHRKKSTSKHRGHTTFSLYVPNSRGMGWIRKKLRSKFLCETAEAKSRSAYIWDLFILNNASSEQRDEWEEMKEKRRNAKALRASKAVREITRKSDTEKTSSHAA